MIPLPLGTTAMQRLALLAKVVRAEQGDPTVRRFARRACDHTRNARECAQALLWAVQWRPYALPVRPGEWIQTDLADVVDAGGDCKALSQLLCAAAASLGIPWQLTWLSYPGREHVSAQLGLEGAWRWADGSVRGARLGESPDEAIERIGGALGTRPPSEYAALAQVEARERNGVG